MKEIYITDRLLPLMEMEGIQNEKDLYDRIINIEEDHPNYKEVKDITSEIKALKKGVWKHSAKREDYKAEIDKPYESKNIDTKFLILYKYFFGCTFEYLLGYSNNPFPEERSISKATGIDEDNVKKLIRTRKTSKNMVALNSVIKYNDFRSNESYLSYVVDYLHSGDYARFEIKRSSNDESVIYRDNCIIYRNGHLYNFADMIEGNDQSGLKIEASTMKEVFLMKANRMLEDMQKKAEKDFSKFREGLPTISAEEYRYMPDILEEDLINIENPMLVETEITLEKLEAWKEEIAKDPNNQDILNWLDKQIKATKEVQKRLDFVKNQIRDLDDYYDKQIEEN